MPIETDKTRKYIYNVLLFMKQDARENPDIRDSIEIIMECIEGAYDIYPAYSKDICGRNAIELAELIKQSQLVQPTFQENNEAATSTNPLNSTYDSYVDEDYYDSGNNFYSRGQYKEAISEYSKAIDMNPSCYIYHLARASAHYHDRNYDFCITDCQEALNLNPSFSEAYGRLGITYCRLNDFENAQIALLTASDLDPKRSVYKWFLSIVDERLSPTGPSDYLLDEFELEETYQVFEDEIGNDVDFGEGYSSELEEEEEDYDYEYIEQHPPTPEDSDF